jgi:hypothetical protein
MLIAKDVLRHSLLRSDSADHCNTYIIREFSQLRVCRRYARNHEVQTVPEAEYPALLQTASLMHFQVGPLLNIKPSLRINLL